jgi:hypothetical protein
VGQHGFSQAFGGIDADPAADDDRLLLAGLVERPIHCGSEPAPGGDPTGF